MIMRPPTSIVVLCLAAVMFCVVPSVHAADVLHRLTHGDQYALALGTVVSVSDATARFEVETVISGGPLPPAVSVEGLGPAMEMTALDMSLEAGDYAVISLNREVAKYTIAWGVFRVSSLDIPTLEVLEGPLALGDLAALQWYINSEGRENDFYFIGSSAFVRHADGTSTQLYPPTDERAEVAPASEPVEGGEDGDGEAFALEWGYALVAGLLLLAGCSVYGTVKARR
jgi:hypothetical protein